MEGAPWSARRDREHAHGFAAFDVDLGAPGGLTTITVTCYDSLGSGAGDLAAFDTFTLRRTRRDRLQQG